MTDYQNATGECRATLVGMRFDNQTDYRAEHAIIRRRP